MDSKKRNMDKFQKTIKLDYAEFKAMEEELERLKNFEKSKLISVYVYRYGNLFGIPRKEEYSIDIVSDVEDQIKKIFIDESSSIYQQMQKLIDVKEELRQISKLDRFNAFFNWNEICKKIVSLIEFD